MPVRPRRRKPITRFIAPLATLMILGYFGYHAFNGHYGIRAHLALQKKLAKLEIELDERTQLRNRLEARVRLLRDGTMERDMVDEQVRRQLNMLREDEIALFH